MAIRNTANWNTGRNLDRWFPDVIGFYMNINHKSYIFFYQSLSLNLTFFESIQSITSLSLSN